MLQMNLAAGPGAAPLPNPVTPVAAIAAYKRFVEFKTNVLLMGSYSIPTTLESTGWIGLRTVQVGGQFTLIAAYDVKDKIATVEMKAAVYFRNFTNACGLVALDPTWCPFVSCSCPAPSGAAGLPPGPPGPGAGGGDGGGASPFFCLATICRGRPTSLPHATTGLARCLPCILNCPCCRICSHFTHSA